MSQSITQHQARWKKIAVIITLKIKTKDIQVPCLLKYPGITLGCCLELSHTGMQNKDLHLSLSPRPCYQGMVTPRVRSKTQPSSRAKLSNPTSSESKSELSAGILVWRDINPADIPCLMPWGGLWDTQSASCCAQILNASFHVLPWQTSPHRLSYSMALLPFCPTAPGRVGSHMSVFTS